MSRKNFVVSLLAVAMVAFSALPLWADCFPTIGMGQLSADSRIASSGALTKLKSASQNFEDKLRVIMARAADHKELSAESVDKILTECAKIYDTKVYDMYVNMKRAKIAAQEFLASWNYGGLTLSAETKNKIDALVKSHFQRLYWIFNNMSRGMGK